MSLSAIVRALVTAGATPEMILAAVEAAEGSQDAAIERRRLNDVERQQRRRDRLNNVTSRDVTVTQRDTLPQGSKQKVSPTPPSKTQPPNPIPEPPIVPQIEAKSKARKGDFAAFWAEYPLKVGRGKAQPAYDQALRRCETDDPTSEILDGLRRCKPLWEPDFIPHATTWLRRDGWLDQLIPDLPDSTGPPRLDLVKFDEERARLAARYEQENAA